MNIAGSLRIALVVWCISALATRIAFADVEEEKDFNVPRSLAVRSLKQLAIQGSIEIFFTDAVVKGVVTKSIRGSYYPRTALDMLLEGTPLEAVQDSASGAYAIVHRTKKGGVVQSSSENWIRNETNSKTEMNLKKNNSTKPVGGFLKALLALGITTIPNASAQDDDDGDIFVLSPFEVSMADDNPLKASSAISAHVAELPMIEIPISMNIVTSDMIENLSVYSNDSYAVAVPGASNVSVGGGESRGIRIRGFSAPVLVNGFRNGSRMDPLWLDRIEVAKGAAALLYGSGATGGAMNLVTKSPSFEQSTTVSLGVGSFDYHRVWVDSTGPIGGEDSQWAYRFIGHDRNIGNQIEWSRDEDRSFFGAIKGNLFDRKLIVDLQYGKFDSDDNKQEIGIPDDPSVDPQGRFDAFVNQNPGFALNISDKYGLGADHPSRGPGAFWDQETWFFQGEVTSTLHEDLTVRLGYSEFDTELLTYWGEPVPTLNLARQQYDPDAVVVDAIYNIDVDGPRGNAQKAMRGDLLWTPDTGGVEHKIVASFRQRKTPAGKFFARRRVRVFGTQADLDRGYLEVPPALREAAISGDLDEINAIGQAGGEIGGVRISSAGFRVMRPVAETEWQEEISLSDHVSFLEGRAHVLAGITYIDSKGNFDPDYARQLSTIFDVGGGLHVFANYSTDFVPTTFQGESDATLQTTTQEGSGYDFGIRFDTLDGKLGGSLSYFDMNRTNIPRRRNIPDNPDTPEDEQRSFFVISGEEESSGIEWTMFYQPTENLSINFQGTLSDPKVVSNEEDPRIEGLRMEDTVDDAVSITTRYSFNDGAMEGVVLGVSGYWRNEGIDDSRYVRRFRQTSDMYVLNAFVSKDIKLFNDVDSTVRLDVRNLLDADDKIVSQGTYERGRYVFGTLEMRF